MKKHVRLISKEVNRPIVATAPFAKVCLMAGGELTNDGGTCTTYSDASRAIFETLATIKGVSYT